MNNRKVNKALIVITVILLIIEILCILITLENYGFDTAISSFGLNALIIVIICTTIGIVSLMWFIYGIVNYYKIINSQKIGFKYIKKVLIMLIMFLISCNTITNIVNTKKIRFTYDYHIEYTIDSDVYDIYVRKGKIEVNHINYHYCVMFLCRKNNQKIGFSDYNMKIVNSFIKNMFSGTRSKSIRITNNDLDEKQLNILYSIINNDETILDNYK